RSGTSSRYRWGNLWGQYCISFIQTWLERYRPFGEERNRQWRVISCGRCGNTVCHIQNDDAVSKIQHRVIQRVGIVQPCGQLEGRVEQRTTQRVGKKRESGEGDRHGCGDHLAI